MTFIYKNKKTGKTIYSKDKLDEKKYILIGTIINGLNPDVIWTKTIQIKS